ncbi:XrtA/PEP-CTERM system histidine kinase PrsK [Methylomonas sp. HYX-M1]|uniref:XrtA/PEP-CTERM system histidine kinase PrsK n=1 Tax=Methylomonas sp. HYX-M1 TaxID=3139307 RepID=UPI00345C0FFF
MDHLLFTSYIISSIAYFFLFLLASFRRNRLLAIALAALISLCWSIDVALTAKSNPSFLADTLVFETLRSVAWLYVLTLLLVRHKQNRTALVLFSKPSLIFGLYTASVISIETFPRLLGFVIGLTDTDPRFVAHVVFAVLGLILSEQLYRNTPLNQRWHVKFLCLCMGAMFAVDLVIYSKSLLYKRLDISLWQSRGLIHALLVPFLAVSLSRLESLQIDASQHTPRKTVFYTTILFGCGIYLLLMSITGYYLREFNEEWGETAQSIFVFLALMLLVITFSSGKVRALAKVYFGKHFFHYSYDYREEWLKISKALARHTSVDELKHFIVSTLMDLVESSGGGLWLRDEQGNFFLAAQQNLHLTPQEVEYLKHGHDLPDYLAKKQWVIDFIELAHAPEVYDDIDLSPWCYEDSQVWLIVPLFYLNHLEAFVILTQPRVARKLNWEDHDLLRTVGMQLANAVALHRASESLASSRQFEAYHRLSAFLVHDLKNVTAQIALIVKNAGKHKHNPEFFDDTLETLTHVVSKMQHIVDQLRQGKSGPTKASVINLTDVIQNIQRHHKGSPPLQVEILTNHCAIKTDPTKLTSILTNLIQNAQDATSQTENGYVKLLLTRQHEYAVIKIIDNGIGMDATFIAERLFKPFDTTKGNAGMGIGVYEARDYVQRSMQGKFEVESQPRQGTTITLLLPLAHSGT